MISAHVLSDALQDLHDITGTSLALYTGARQLIASFPESADDYADQLDTLLSSPADSMEIRDSLFIKIPNSERPEYVLVAGGKNRDLTYRIAVSEITHLIMASQERNDRNRFIQNILLDNLLPAAIHTTARKMKIRDDIPRTVYLVETIKNDNDIALEMLLGIYSSAGGTTFVAPTDRSHIAVVSNVPENSTPEALAKNAYTLSDTLNAEAMISVRVSYGSPVSSLSKLSQSYKEAQLAMNVGRIFYPDRHVISYGKLGIGRLIYQLPPSLCEVFLNETFDHDVFAELDEETLTTIRHFFNNNLNISETARQLYIHRNTLVYRLEKLQKSCGLDIRKFDEAMTFKIAMMVNDYLKNTDT